MEGFLVESKGEGAGGLVGSKHFILCLVLGQPRKTDPNMTEKMLS